MKIDKVVLILALTCLVLLGLLVFPQVSNLVGDNMGESSSPLAVDIADISAITVQRASESLTVTREEDRWSSEAGAVEKTEWQRLLDALGSLSVESVAARSAATYDNLGIATTSATIVTLRTNQGERQLEVGANGPRINTFYARWVDQPEVYLVDNPLRNILSGSFSEFISLQPTEDASPGAQATE